jgi:hypothetical protein
MLLPHKPLGLLEPATALRYGHLLAPVPVKLAVLAGVLAILGLKPSAPDPEVFWAVSPGCYPPD